MNYLLKYIICIALAVAGVLGTTLSVPLESPAVILFGIGGVIAGVRKFANQELQNSSTTKLPNSKTSIAALLGLVLVSIGYFVVRACLSPVWDLGVEDLMLIVSAGILYLIAGYAVTGKSGILMRQGLAWVVVVLLLLHVGSCVMQLNGGEGYSLAYYFTGAGRSSPENVTGMYSYYGSFANFSVIAGILCLALGIWGRAPHVVRALLVLLGILALGLAVWSRSRSAVVSLVPALILFFVLLSVSTASLNHSVKKRFSKLLMLLGGVGIILGVSGGAWVFKVRAPSAQGADVMFADGARMPFWPMAMEQWINHPVVGAGSRSFSYECFKYWNPNLDTGAENPEFVHNEYLQLLADYGVIGLLLICALLFGHLVVGSRRVYTLSGLVGEDGFRKGSNAMALAIAGISGMVAMGVHIIFDFRTHLLANLLLLVMCAVWVLPVTKIGGEKLAGRGRSDILKWILGVSLIILGALACFLGWQQLRAGIPILKHRMAKEDGEWVPQLVPRGIWIPTLEESLVRVPQWRRYQRLGTLYRLEAATSEGEVSVRALRKAEEAYLASIEQHAYNPIPRINLASIYTERGEYEKADEAFEKAASMSKARERWFRMHVLWGELHQQWAVALWKQGEVEQAEIHFRIAKELHNISYDLAAYYDYKQWVSIYTRILVQYSQFLDSQKRYSEAGILFKECRQQKDWVNMQVDTKLGYFEALHLYAHGRAVWYQRKPDEAYQLMKQAKARILKYRIAIDSEVDKDWHEHLKKIEDVIGFLENAGVKGD